MSRPIAMVARSLHMFQDGFADALCGRPSPAAEAPEIARLTAQPAFAVYRNSVIKSCVDALQANYPAVASLAGGDWFRAAAADFVRDHPPSNALLLAYGRNFADFLAASNATGALRGIADVARIDRFWTEAHIAPDEAPHAPQTIARLTPAKLGAAVLRPHAAARWFWFDAMPTVSVWERQRFLRENAIPAADAGSPIGLRGEGILITRPHAEIKWTRLDRSGCAFLDACAAFGTLGEAAAAALAVDSCVDLAGLLARVLAAGAFSGDRFHPTQAKETLQ